MKNKLADFDRYQRLAQKTDQNPSQGGAPGKAELIPLLGMAGEVGNLLSEYKKLLRDGPVHLRFREQVREELGDIMWYVANAATKFQLSLTDVAGRNLRKTRDRWTPGGGGERLFDAAAPAGERLPRLFELRFGYRTFKGKRKVVLMDTAGRRMGNPLTDNAYVDDGYRFHDVMHLAHVALLGWSPVSRKLLSCKRKSMPDIDEVEDGGRAAVIEEAIVALIYEYATRHKMLEGATKMDWETIRTIKRLTKDLEVRVRTAAEWEAAIFKGMEVWRQVHAHDGGTVRGDVRARTFEFIPPGGQGPRQRPPRAAERRHRRC